MYRSLYIGDYRMRQRGDVFGFVKKALGGVAKVAGFAGKIAGKVLPGPLGMAAGTLGKVAGGVGVALTGAGTRLPLFAGAGGASQYTVTPSAFMPGGAPLVTQAGVCTRGVNRDGSCRKRPTMNPTNPRALRRAIRRQQGFVKIARRALSGTGYRIARRGEGAARRGARRRAA